MFRRQSYLPRIARSCTIMSFTNNNLNKTSIESNKYNIKMAGFGMSWAILMGEPALPLFVMHKITYQHYPTASSICLMLSIATLCIYLFCIMIIGIAITTTSQTYTFEQFIKNIFF